MDIPDVSKPLQNAASDGHARDLEMEISAPDVETKDGFDTLGLSSGPDAFPHTGHDQQEMEQFLRSAGVEVTEGDHDVNSQSGMDQGLELHMEGEADHIPHGDMMGGMLDLSTHEMHVDDLHLDMETHQEPATFDLHQIHQELNDATSFHENHEESSHASDIAIQHDAGLHAEQATTPSLSRTLFDSNLAPSPNDRGLHPESHLQEQPVPTGVQIVNEEVLVNDIGLSPLGEGLPSAEALELMKEEADLLAQQVSITRRGKHAVTDIIPIGPQGQDQLFDASPQQSGPSGAEMLKTPSAAGNPPLPIDHALTEPITAFYKLQFLEPPPLQTSGARGEYRPKEAFSYYMQTLDVTIGRKINRLKKSVQDQASEPHATAEGQFGPDEGHVKLEDGEQPSIAQEKEHELKAESSAVFQEQSIITKNNDGEDGPEDGKRSTPPEVPPAKEIAKPPIDNGPEQQKVEQGEKHEHDQGMVIVRAEDDDGFETSIRIIKSESDHRVISGRDGGHGDDADERQVDVDLGALKSVSRLHARIG